jgi:hypothetical protein
MTVGVRLNLRGYVQVNIDYRYLIQTIIYRRLAFHEPFGKAVVIFSREGILLALIKSLTKKR